MNFLSFEKKLIPLDVWVQDLVDWLDQFFFKA